MVAVDRMVAPQKDLLRFTTAGSVDDGKSTLIGRLLCDSQAVYEDQLAAARSSTINRSTGPLDFSLLTDGLRAEREQGITIDVAYRYFSTSARKFIVADTPGHVQYTRNMATGASTADLAVILIDGRNGVQQQSRRHACITALLGIPRVVAVVNKMDLVNYCQDVFEAIRLEFSGHLERLGIVESRFIPVNSLEGDNVARRSARMPWYDGPSLLEYLESAPSDEAKADASLRFPVQQVMRPDSGFRGYAGQLISGCVRPGDPVMALPSGRTTRVKSIPTYDGDRAEAFAGMSVAICLEDELDISRGDMLVHPFELPHVSRRMEARLVWMHDEPLALNRPYLIKHTTQLVGASITSLHSRVDVNTLAEARGERLELNDIGLVTLETKKPLFFDPYRVNRGTGSFILIDPVTNATVAAGMIQDRPREQPAGRDAKVALGELEFKSSRLTPAERFTRSGHYPAVIWLAARRELAFRLEEDLFSRGCQVHVVAEEMESTILPELAQLLSSAGLITIFSVAGFDAAECNRAQELVGCRWFVRVAPEDLPASDEQAVRHLSEELERRGLVRASARFNEGEGI